MGYDDLKRRFFIFFAIQYLAQPFGLFRPVFVVNRYAGIFDIGIRFILSRIEDHETDRTLPERVVDIFFFRRKIALDSVAKAPRVSWLPLV